MKFDRIPFVLFLASASSVVFAYGLAVGKYQVFPYRFLELAVEGFQSLNPHRLDPFTNKPVDHHKPPITYRAGRAYDGLNLVSRISADLHISIDLMDMEGTVLHAWDADWFDIWPNATHLPAHRVPKSPPGTLIHGCQLLPDGDIVYNYEACGMVRLAPDGSVVWRLPYETHHSLEIGPDGNLWTGGLVYHSEADARFPHRQPPFYDETILVVSPKGEILHEWSVTELLMENDLGGLLEISSLHHPGLDLVDPLHLNDVEPFPRAMAEGVFHHGDVLVSFRNLNTLLVLNPVERTVKYLSSGRVIRQHDPDFRDGDHLSVFDNNSPSDDPEFDGTERFSRIVEISARDNSLAVLFEGSPEQPFFSHIMGKHQLLPNGDLLITEAMKGRAFEVDAQGELVWEYVNYVAEGMVGIVSEVKRYPLDYLSTEAADKLSIPVSAASPPRDLRGLAFARANASVESSSIEHPHRSYE